ncbi:hypothetical protein [Pseudoalteromonas sp. MMG005]|uniref:hypothetical protein n=1 Tax=Pseudoalteromonas sp. MMG005 TaxID=2822682 RepID=UPI001B3A50AB|nr:hypothetical protein [Pseudoalteromonas sp. MMG005]MBQ4845962.1 hypothetical protein [Pseudoalteromonas sp. MMG005]
MNSIINNNIITSRFVRVNGVMKKVRINGADDAFVAALKVRNGRKKQIEQELLVHGLTG